MITKSQIIAASVCINDFVALLSRVSSKAQLRLIMDGVGATYTGPILHSEWEAVERGCEDHWYLHISGVYVAVTPRWRGKVRTKWIDDDDVIAIQKWNGDFKVSVYIEGMPQTTTLIRIHKRDKNPRLRKFRTHRVWDFSHLVEMMRIHGYTVVKEHYGMDAIRASKKAREIDGHKRPVTADEYPAEA